MKPTHVFPRLLFLLFLVSLACTLPPIAPIATPPTATLPAAPPDSNKATLTATPPNATNTPLPPTETPTQTPTEPLAASPYQPAGYVIAPPGGGSAVLYDLAGQVISRFPAPGFFGDTSGHAILVGPFTDDPASLALVYYSWETTALMVTNQSEVRTLMSAPNFYTLVGLPDIPFIAFTYAEFADTGLRSSLIVGDYPALPTAPVMMTVLNTDGNAVRPLGITTNQGEPVGVYYTTVPFGIGGDIVFEPRRTLSYVNTTTYEPREVLGIATNPVGLSPDLTWLAYTPVDIGPLSISPLASLGNQITVPLLVDSDRGAGAAYFSPDNHYLAWKEGSGWLMAETPNFHATIRIATTTGSITAEVPDSTISALLGSNAAWVEPVGWLDAQTLLIEVRGDDWENVTLIRVNYDGSGLAVLIQGTFVDFIYR
jgi:hypothetical protein